MMNKINICILFSLIMFLALPSIEAVAVQGWVFNSDGSPVPAGTSVVIQNINTSTMTILQTGFAPPSYFHWYAISFEATNGQTVKVTSYNATWDGWNQTVSDGSSVIRMNITLNEPILKINSPSSNSIIYNNLTGILNVSSNSVSGFNNSIWYTFTKGKVNFTICTSPPECLESQTTINFRTTGYFNITSYANSSAGYIVSDTKTNVYVANISTYNLNTSNGMNAFDWDVLSGTCTTQQFPPNGGPIPSDPTCSIVDQTSNSALLYKDSNYLSTRLTGEDENALQLFYAPITLSQTVTSLNWSWYGNTAPNLTAMYIWNNTNSSWMQCQNISSSQSDQIMSCGFSSSTDLINSSGTTFISMVGLGNLNLFSFLYTDFINLSVISYTANELPTFTIYSPQNQTVYSDRNITLNVSLDDLNYDSLKVYTYLNQTSSLLDGDPATCNCTYNISNIDYNGNVYFNFTNLPDGEYFWRMKADDGKGNGTSQKYSFIVTADYPAVNLNLPSSSSYLKINEVTFNATATDSDGIANFTLYLNTSGTFEANQTNQSAVTSGTLFSWTVENIPEGTFIWNALAFDNADKGSFALSNRTFTVDTTLPAVNITYLKTTINSQTITFNVTASDINLNTCKYSILNSSGGVDGLYNNISIGCNANGTSATVSAYGSYTLIFYALDLAGNENSTTKSFTTSSSGGVVGGTGGVTGGIFQSILTTNFTIQTETFGNLLDFVLAKGSVRPREKQFIIINKAKEPIDVRLVCDTTLLNESESINITNPQINICDYVYFENTTITLSSNELNPSVAKILVYTPENASYGDVYYYNILAITQTEQEELYAKLSVRNSVPRWAIIYKWAELFGQGDKPEEERTSYPVFWVSLIVSLVSYFLVLLGFSIFKVKGQTLPVTSFIASTFAFFSIFALLLFIL